MTSINSFVISGRFMLLSERVLRIYGRGRTQPFDEAMADIRKRIKERERQLHKD